MLRLPQWFTIQSPRPPARSWISGKMHMKWKLWRLNNLFWILVSGIAAAMRGAPGKTACTCLPPHLKGVARQQQPASAHAQKLLDLPCNYWHALSFSAGLLHETPI